MRPRMFRSTLILALACVAGTAHAADAAVAPPKPDAR
ncbi:sulfur oxidation c-type cytochrome SoxX, partial [Ralstonia pseudosolanacearum]